MKFPTNDADGGKPSKDISTQIRQMNMAKANGNKDRIGANIRRQVKGFDHLIDGDPRLR